jgi:hypothetical protein
MEMRYVSAKPDQQWNIWIYHLFTYYREYELQHGTAMVALTCINLIGT